MPFPHDARLGCPVLVRASPQVLLALESGVGDRAMRNAAAIRWLPDDLMADDPTDAMPRKKETEVQQPRSKPLSDSAAYERIKGTLATRPSSWCLSRQRAWGLRMPLLCDATSQSIPENECGGFVLDRRIYPYVQLGNFSRLQKA